MGKIILYRAKYFNCYEVLCFMGILNEKKKQWRHNLTKMVYDLKAI